MARFFLYSDSGDSVFLARRLLAEGHAVTTYLKHPAARFVGDGLIPKVRTPIVPHGAIVLFDGVGHGNLGRTLRARGHRVIGGNPFDQTLEVDRTKGTALMGEYGIATPRTETFRDGPSAQAFLATHDDGTEWFFKPSGNQSTSLTMNGSPEFLGRFLGWALPQLPPATPFELQQLVEGTELSTEGWFDGERFVPPFNGTFEEKRLLVGNIGPRAGCASNVVWRWEHDAVPNLTVARLTDRLRQERYVGPLDLNMIIDDHGIPHGLEWSARFGFDALQALALLIDGDFGAQLEAFAEGRLDQFRLRPDLALTLRVSMAPYPRDSPEGAPEIRGHPLDERFVTHPRFFPDDVMVTKQGVVCAGRDGSLGTVGAVGDDLQLLRDRVLAIGESLPKWMQYRTDPMERAEKGWQALQEYGLGREGATDGTVAAAGA